MSEALNRFAELVQGPHEPPLDEAALAIAAGADPGVEPVRWLEELDRLAAGVADLDGLVQRLFVERGFAGNPDDYYDVANSLLHRVIQRRLGIPITLSVVMMEVGRRAGITIEGVGMPGHFLVRAGSGALLDPFHGGRPLDEAAVAQRFRRVGGQAPRPDEEPALPTVGPRQILDRMLGNLVGIHRSRGEAEDLERVVRMRLALPGPSTETIAHLGEALAMQGRFRAGAEEIEARAGDDARAQVVARELRARLN